MIKINTKLTYSLFLVATLFRIRYSILEILFIAFFTLYFTFIGAYFYQSPLGIVIAIALILFILFVIPLLRYRSTKKRFGSDPVQKYHFNEKKFGSSIGSVNLEYGVDFISKIKYGHDYILIFFSKRPGMLVLATPEEITKVIKFFQETKAYAKFL